MFQNFEHHTQEEEDIEGRKEKKIEKKEGKSIMDEIVKEKDIKKPITKEELEKVNDDKVHKEYEEYDLYDLMERCIEHLSYEHKSSRKYTKEHLQKVYKDVFSKKGKQAIDTLKAYATFVTNGKNPYLKLWGTVTLTQINKKIMNDMKLSDFMNNLFIHYK